MAFKLEDGFSHVYELPVVSDSFKKLFDTDEKTPNEKRRALIVVFKSTHAARNTRNDTFYPPAHVRDAVPTWTKDYAKPVIKDHGGGMLNAQTVSDMTIGRVIGARYVDLSAGMEAAQKDSYKSLFNDSLDAESLAAISNIVNLQDSGADWEGLGYDELILEITDQDAIEKFLTNRYVTGSSGKTADTVYCSICGKDFLKDGMCTEHKKGVKYDVKDKDGKVIGSKKCVWVTGPYKNDEYSVTPFPANEKSSKVSQTVIFKDAIDLYVWEEDANILNKHTDVTKNIIRSGMSLNDTLIPTTIETGIEVLEQHYTFCTDASRKHIISNEVEGHKHRFILDPETKNGYSSWDTNHSHDVINNVVGTCSAVRDYSKQPVLNANGEYEYPIVMRAHTHTLDKEVEPLRDDLITSIKAPEIPALPQLPDTLKYKFLDWEPAALSILADRIKTAEESDYETIIQEVEEDVYNDSIATIKYDKDIKPLLDKMIKDVKSSKKLDDVELADADVKVIVEGIDKAILAESARLRLTKKHCISGIRELPVVDKFHAIALKQFITDSSFAVSVKTKFLEEVARLEKALGLVIPKTEFVEPKTYNDVYSKLSDKERSLVDTQIADSLKVIKESNEYVPIAVYNTLKDEMEVSKKEADTKLNESVTTIADLTKKVEHLTTENKLFTNRIMDKNKVLIDLLVDSIIDIKLINDETLNINEYSNELLGRSIESLNDQLRDLRKALRDETQRNKSNVEENDESMTEAQLSNIKKIPPAQLRYYNSIRLNFDKETK